MSFYEEIIKRAKELGGDAYWHDMTVGHGTSERVLVVTAPYKTLPRQGKANKLSNMKVFTDALIIYLNRKR